MPPRYEPTRRPWRRKFGEAFLAIGIGMRGQGSFYVHLLAASLVIVAATWLRVSRLEWCILTICIAMVLSLEMLNRALEILAKAVTNQENRHLRDGLNVASAAVLLASVGAVAVGLMVFVPAALSLW